MAEEEPKKQEKIEDVPELKADRDDALGYSREQLHAQPLKPKGKKKLSKKKRKK